MNRLRARNVLLQQLRRNHHFEAPFLQKNDANFVNLSPLSLFQRTVRVFPSLDCYHHGQIARTWRQVDARVRKFASALKSLDVRKSDVVSIIVPNSPSIFEAHFAVPATGAVLHSINTRSDAHVIAFQLKHAKTKILLVDSDHRQAVADALKLLENKADYPKAIVEIRDEENPHVIDLKLHQDPSHPYIYHEGEHLQIYEDFLASGDAKQTFDSVSDEWDAISLNYTSGTTGNPKGVVCHHRGAYLNALSNALEWNMPQHARYLWIVPLFHCNGWCFAWTMAAVAGTSFFVREIRPQPIFDVIQKHKVQYFAGAPITMHILLNHSNKIKFDHEVKFWAGGAPPPPAVIKRFKEEIGVSCETVYGLTEVYGPVTRHQPDADWKAEGLSAEEIGERCTYQIGDAMMDDYRVMDPATMKEVPEDGKTIGEVMLRGNVVMKGYLGNEKATNEAFEGGFFHTGDLAVSHPNGRFELKDRAKDIIISGGENISSIEVENTIIKHPAVGEVAVVAMTHDFWGEVPCAFVTVRPGTLTENIPTPEELIKWARNEMPHYCAPKHVQYVDQLPKTSTGKVQKHELRKFLKLAT